MEYERSRKPVQRSFWVADGEPDLCDYFVVLRWDAPESGGREKPSWVDFELHEVVAGGDTLEFRIGEENLDALTPDVAQATATASGYVKWDGCTHIDGLGGHHCDARSIVKRVEALKAARNAALQAMGKDEPGIGDWLESTC